MAERLEYAPAAGTVDTNEKILNLAAEITGKPADLNSITGDKEPQRHKAGTFNAVAFQRAKLAKRLADELRHESPVLDTPEKLASLLREDNRLLGVEHFYVVLVNTKRRLIRVETLAQGTLDSLVTHPRDVFRPAITANASALFLAHNHPSGDPTPSEADIKFTRDIIRAGKLLKIDVLDHIILGRRTAERGKDFASLRELGYFYT